jgi:hypothetical protein
MVLSFSVSGGEECGSTLWHQPRAVCEERQQHVIHEGHDVWFTKQLPFWFVKREYADIPADTSEATMAKLIGLRAYP